MSHLERDWNPYLRELADLLALRDWKVVISPEPCPEDAYAEFVWLVNHLEAKIRLCAEWETLPREKQRLTLVHELIHAHQARTRGFIGEEVYQQLGRGMGHLVQGALDRDFEQFAATLADVISPHMPLPPEAEDPQEAAS